MARTAWALAAPLLLLLAAQAARAANFETSIVDAELAVTSEWATGFCGQLITKNPGSNPSSSWAGLFTFQGGELTSEPQGNGVAEKLSASQWTFKPTDPAQMSITGGSPVTVAFCCEECSPDTVRAGFRVIFSYDWRGKGETAEEAAAPAPAPAAAEEEADEEVAAAPAPAPVAAEQAAAGDARRNGPRVPRKAGPKKPAGTATTAAPAPAAAPTSVADKATLEAAADILSSIPARGAGGKKPRGVTKPAAVAAPAPAPAAAEAEAEEEEAVAAAPAPATSDAATAAAAPALAPTAELLTDPGLATADEIIDGAAAAPAPALAAAADILASIPIPGSEAAPEPKRPRGRRQGADVGAEWWVSDSELREDAQELEEADDPWWREDI